MVCNFSPIHRKGYYVGAPFAGTWTPIFNTDAEEFGGNGLGDKSPLKTVNTPCHVNIYHFCITLPPFTLINTPSTRPNPLRKPKDARKEATDKKTASKSKKAGDGNKSAATKTAARKSKSAARPSPKLKSED